jgi:hypothetical protein
VSAFYVIDAASHAALSSLVESVHACFIAAVKRCQSDAALMRLLRVPEHALQWLQCDGAAPRVGRMDIALGNYDVATGSFTPRVLEYNGDTPGIIVESTVLQQAFERQLMPRALSHNGLSTAGCATTGGQLWSMVRAAYQRAFGRRRVSLLHHYGSIELLLLAHTLEAICRDGGVDVRRVVYPAMPTQGDDDATPDYTTAILKLFRWVSIWGPTASPADSKFPPLSQYFVDRLRDCYGDGVGVGGTGARSSGCCDSASGSASAGGCDGSADPAAVAPSGSACCDPASSGCAAGPVVEPPSSYLLQHKGVLALLSEMLPGHPNLLHTTLDDPATLPHANSSGFVHKPWHGIGGECVRLFLPHGRVVSNAKASQQSSMAAASGLGGAVSEDAAGDDAPLDSYARIKSSLPQGVFQEYVQIDGVPDALFAAEVALVDATAAGDVPGGAASPASAGTVTAATAAESVGGSGSSGVPSPQPSVSTSPTLLYPILSVWVVDGKCAGYILREGDHPVTYDERAVPVIVSSM